jgi:hypothetical protein
MDNLSIIRKTNLEYARLLRDILKRHESFTRDHLRWGEGEALAQGDGPIAVPTRWGFVSAYQNACLSAAADAHSFWAKYGQEYASAVRQAELLKLSLPRHPSPAMFLYFDTAVVHDTLPGCTHPDLDNRAFVAGGIIRGLSRLLPLLEAQSDVPMLVIKALKENSFLQPNWTREFDSDKVRDPVIRHSNRLASRFLKNAAAISDPPDRLIDWLLPEPSEAVDLARLFRPGPIAALFAADRKVRKTAGDVPYPMPVMLLHAPSGLMEAMEGRLGRVSPLEFKSFFVSLLDVFCTVASVELTAVETRGDSFFDSPEVYAIRLEIDGRTAATDFHLTEEQAAALCISSPDFPSFAPDLASAIAFRERGGPHLLREAMREQRSRICAASPDNLSDVTNGLVDALRLRLDAHADEMQRLLGSIQHAKGEIKLNALKLGAMTGLNYLMPPLLGAAATLFLSAPTLLDIYRYAKETRELNKQIRSWADQPICMFEGSLGTGRPIFKWPWVLD